MRIEGDAASAFREERIWVGGRSVRYLTSGEGPPLVLVHALGENALDWSWVRPALSRGHRVYAPDLPGITDGVAAARLHKSRPVYIPDCGHLSHVERPERFAEALGRFLDEVRSR